MKSRFLSQLKLTNVDAATSSHAQSLTRRFDLQYNASPRFARRRQQRREGQALLLAVLIMLLAALLSAGVLAVVSGNLNQTARIADKTKAIEASRAGIAYANAQLSGSANGDMWRPVDVSPAPIQTDNNYNTYYSQLDKVQGWANTRPTTDPLYRDTAYAKFPAPDQPIGDAPKFLVKVEQLTTDSAAANYDADHAGEIKITSIGLSDDDPNVFNTAIAYKEGRRKSPMASALRSVSNWNFGVNNQPTGVPYAQVSAVAAAGATANSPATNVDVQVETRVGGKDAPQFSAANVPFNVVIINKGANSSVRGAVVTAVTPPAAGATTATLRLARVEAPIGTDETIQKAAAIGTGSTIDLLNTGTPATLASLYPLGKDELYQRNGILANGSMWLQGQIQLSDLNKFGTKIVSSGSIALDAASKPVVAPTTLPNPNYGIAGTGTLVSSDSTNFPGTFTTDSGAKVTPLDIINDGWNKIGAQTLGLDYSNSRDVEPFTPAKIDSASNLARYRALTRNSATSIYNGVPYQNGVYIDNRDDVEKVGTTPMTQTQLVEMLISPATSTAKYARTIAGEPVGTVGKSLEEKHLRGWIGPDEFLARGALVEILPTAGPDGNAPSLRVTLDARGDSTTAAPNNDSGPDNNKAFRKTDGTLDTGVYTKVLPWPANGTLFAEGNLRIRGDVGTTVAAPRSLTVVSLGNIYVEGSLSVDNTLTGTNPSSDRKKLMLMAKKNVVVNPTRLVLGHVDAQTVATAPVTVAIGANTGLPVFVADSSQFKIGDRVIVDTTTGTVTNITSETQIEIATNNATAAPIVIPTNTPVRLVQWKDDYTQAAPYFKVNAANSINRRVLLQNAATDYPNLRLDLDHAGSRPATGTAPAFKIATEDLGLLGTDLLAKPTGLEVKVTNKRVNANTTFDPRTPTVEVANKRLRAAYNLPAPAGTDEFPDAATVATFVDEATAQTFSLTSLENALNAKTHPDLIAVPPTGWKYKATKDPALANVPVFYLAAVGLRNDKFSSAAATADNGVKNIGGAEELDIPLATSVRLTRNGAPQDLTATYREMAGTNAEYTVPYLGFNPTFGIGTTVVEDALTVDQSFYQTDTDVLKSTLDSRRTATPFGTGDSIALRQNNDLLGLPAGVTAPTLPLYRVRALKLENTKFPAPATPAPPTPAPPTPDALVIQPVNLGINAYVYAQEGSWLVIPGDYFRSAVNNTTGVGNAVRSDAAGEMTYIDFDNDGNPDVGEYVDADASTTPTVGDFADLNRNGILDPGELEAALRFVRYNYAINFYGAIVENQTAVVADVKDAAGTTTLVNGAVQDWMDKWAAYDSTVGSTKTQNFKFITYAYDPSIADGSAGANQLRIPLTDDLIYQQ